MSNTAPSIAIIGAGTSGVIAAKTLLAAGFAVEVFEKGSGIGGLWRFGNDNGHSTAYRSLHINTVRQQMDLSDFAFPEDAPLYPAHHDVLAFFERYVDRFGVRPHIRFRTEVKRAARREGGGWRLDIAGPDGASAREVDFLVVANGHHWNPRPFSLPGSFDGPVLHAHHYVDPTDPLDLAGKRVVVVGSGNSAMDIVCELGAAARGPSGPAKVFLSQRSGVWIIPKLIGSIPANAFPRNPNVPPDEKERERRRTVPRAERNAELDRLMTERILATVGHPTRLGLKAPTVGVVQRHPTVSQDIHSRLLHGDIVPKGGIAAALGDRLRFEDGSEERVDAVIHATGYRIAFPFFDEALISAPGNDIALWKRIFDPRFPDLAFLGLVQQRYGAMMPLVELQSWFVRDILLGKIALPPADVMRAETDAMHEAAKAEYVASESHTIQTDCLEYSWDLFEAWPRLERYGRGAPA